MKGLCAGRRQEPARDGEVEGSATGGLKGDEDSPCLKFSQAPLALFPTKPRPWLSVLFRFPSPVSVRIL